jgi:SET domain
MFGGRIPGREATAILYGSGDVRLDPDLRRQAPVELREPMRTEPLDVIEGKAGVLEQRRDVHPLTSRGEGPEVQRSACEHVDRAVMIEPPQVVKCDPDLQDALIQPPHSAWFGAPQQLERLVLLEVLAAVELIDALEEQPRRRLTAPVSHRQDAILLRMIQKRRSKIHGWGIYATKAIPKNTRVIHYAGEKISNQESLKRERRYIQKGHIWCFKLTNRTVIDAGVGGNDARFINHSCRPNCYIDIKGGVIWIRASRTIAKGEELTYHYNTDGEGLIKCRCRNDCQTLL